MYAVNHRFMPVGQRIRWSMAAILRDVVFRGWADVPVIHAASHDEYKKKVIHVFCISMYACGSVLIVMSSR